MKKPSKRNLIKKCDELYSLIIRSIGYCEICGRTDIQLNGHHIIGRAVMILRYDFRNGCSLCVNCHEFAKDSVKNNPIKFLRWLQKYRADDLAYVESKSNIIAHYTVSDLQQIYQKLMKVWNETGK